MKTLIPLTLLLLLTGCVHGKHFDIETGIFLPNKPATNSMVLPAAPGNTHEGTNIVSAPLPPAPPQVSLFADAFNAPLTAEVDVPIAITPDGIIIFPDLKIILCGQTNVVFQGATTPSGPWTSLVTNLISVATNIPTVLPKLGTASFYRAFAS